MKKPLLKSIKWNPLVVLSLFLMFLQNVQAQENITVEGTVNSASEDSPGPLPFITILVKGTTRGTTTDFDGKYSINVAPNSVLVFSYVSI